VSNANQLGPDDVGYWGRLIGFAIFVDIALLFVLSFIPATGQGIYTANSCPTGSKDAADCTSSVYIGPGSWIVIGLGVVLVGYLLFRLIRASRHPAG
jgi:hypothetical protein